MKVLLLSLGLGRMLEFLKPPAIIGFIGTAGETYEDPYFVIADRKRLIKMGYSIVDIDVSGSSRKFLQSQLSDVDGLFVAGGNSFYLLQQLKKSGMDQLISDFVDRGGYYIGASAGAAVCGPSLMPVVPLDEPEKAPDLENLDALNMVDVVTLPHYGKEKYLPVYQKIIADHESNFELAAIRDDQCILMNDRKNYKILESALLLHD